MKQDQPQFPPGYRWYGPYWDPASQQWVVRHELGQHAAATPERAKALAIQASQLSLRRM